MTKVARSAVLTLGACACAISSLGQPARCDSSNLLADRRPSRSYRASGAPSITDGRVASKGAPWDTVFAAELNDEGAYIQYDLETSTPITALFAQTDNNDSYRIELSDDGESWTLLWTVPTAEHEGMQIRFADELDGRGRFVRIGFAEGDGAYSVGELQAFCETPASWPPDLPVDLDRETELSLAKIAFGAFGLVVLMLPWGRIRSPRAERIAYVALIGASAYTWINFGSFHGARAVHLWDSMHYYMGSKYFAENGYRLLYACIAVAEADDGRRADVLSREYRDLEDNRLESGAAALAREPECREAFTPMRWRAFQQDVRLFRTLMGASWFAESRTDHGYNATPVWNRIGTTLSNWRWESRVPPEELVSSPVNLRDRSPAEQRAIAVRFHEDGQRLSRSLERLAWIDGALYAGIFGLIGWAFGLRAAALAAIVWAVGHPWAYYWTGGAFGRIFWLFTAVAGTCCVKAGRPVAGGFLLTSAALLRVFPAVLLAGIAVHMIRDFRRRLPILAGGIAALILLVPLSGIDNYPAFVENSARHQATPLTNHMGLPVLVSWHPDTVARTTQNDEGYDAFALWKDLRRGHFQNRWWLYVVLVASLALLYVRAASPLDDWKAVCLAVFGIFALFELTSYYYVFVILLAPVAHNRFTRTAALVGMAAGTQVAALYIGWFDELHTVDSLIVFVVLVYFLVDVIRTEARTPALAPRS